MNIHRGHSQTRDVFVDIMPHAIAIWTRSYLNILTIFFFTKLKEFMQRTNMKNLKTSKLQIYRCIHKKEIEYLQRIGHPFSNYCYVFLQVLDEKWNTKYEDENLSFPI